MWGDEGDMRSRKGPAVMIAIAYFVIGLALLIQPYRWYNTPSYANLLQLASTQVWGTVYLVTSLLLVAAVRWRYTTWVMILSHTVAISLSGAWLIAFVVRFATDDGTTIVNVVSWSVFLYRLIQSAVILDDEITLEEINAKERRRGA